MSTRLQVVLDEKEYREIKKVARRKGLTVSGWVGRSLREARTEEPTTDASRKLEAPRNLLDFLRDSPFAEAVAEGELDLAISVLTLGEIRKGILLLPGGRRRERLHEWLRADLTRQFTDGVLLATAEVHGLTFVTRNEKEWTDRGVPVLNPWSG